MEEQVILVDREDIAIGEMGKMNAHEIGALHRAFSIFIFNRKGELLMQQRALDKYHSAGKWTNTCCSHPRPLELTEDAAKRRLKEEMGMDCELTYGFNFLYKAAFSNELTEHEFDHVYFGISDQMPQINPSEVASYKYVNLQDLQRDLIENPDLYTAWLKVCFNKVLDFKIKNYE
ncbi:MAG: isopentenyl-diphosphate Delta-isomerase [Pedobacter sp.]|nr:MAG: isopentenyl-diphosphate Delta-isomerase [Pedobacter sp.]